MLWAGNYKIIINHQHRPADRQLNNITTIGPMMPWVGSCKIIYLQAISKLVRIKVVPLWWMIRWTGSSRITNLQPRTPPSSKTMLSLVGLTMTRWAGNCRNHPNPQPRKISNHLNNHLVHKGHSLGLTRLSTGNSISKFSPQDELLNPNKSG